MNLTLKAYLLPKLRPKQRAFRRLRADIMRILALPLKLSPFSSKVAGPPKGAYASAADWLLSGGDTPGIDKVFQKLHDQEKIYRTKPHSLDGKIHWKIRNEYKHITPEIFVANGRDIRLWTHRDKAGQIDALAYISQDDLVIGGLSDDWTSDLESHRVFSQFYLGKAYSLPGTSLVLADLWGNQFYHWFLGILPKIAMVKDAGVDLDTIDSILVNNTSQPFVRDCLKKMGIPLEKLVSTKKHPFIEADQMIIPSRPWKLGNPPEWAVKFLRDTFLPATEESKEYPKKFYISRSYQIFRHVVNEAEITEFLKPMGVVPVNLENYNLEQQIALFAGAELIITPHDERLALLALCQPKTKVIEFFSPLYVNAAFYSLSSLVNLSYYYLIGEGPSHPEGKSPEIGGANIRLSLTKLKATLDFAEVEEDHEWKEFHDPDTVEHRRME
ncbi:MAG: glycosyltransferase family 61 protein [Bacteroidia bacterium]